MEEGYTLIWSFRNRFNELKKSIETADKFTPKNVDFCLVDAASSDETIQQLRLYCSAITDRVIRICESTYRTNLCEAWNLGMMLTKNRYVIFSSSDVEFYSPNWFIDLKSHHVSTKDEYILVENHSIFLIDKKIIPRTGWFDEEFGYGPHQDCDYMIRSSENKIKLSIIPNKHYYKHEDSPEETILRGTTDMPNRLPMNDLGNEIRFKSKWRSSWPGWGDYFNKVNKPHPPTHISAATRLIPELDPHPHYTQRYEKE